MISIAVEPEIVIQDNGDGTKTDTIKSILDYNIRVSSREASVSPTRGQQGNALKTILAMGSAPASPEPISVTTARARKGVLSPDCLETFPHPYLRSAPMAAEG